MQAYKIFYAQFVYLYLNAFDLIILHSMLSDRNH